MSEQQKSYTTEIRVRSVLGVPVLMQRVTVPAESAGTWRWGRWRLADRLVEVVVNAHLMKRWS